MVGFYFGKHCLKVETLYFIMAEMCLSEVNVDNCVFNLAVNSNNKLAFVISFLRFFTCLLPTEEW